MGKTFIANCQAAIAAEFRTCSTRCRMTHYFDPYPDELATLGDSECRRSLFLALASVLLTGLGTFEARAGSVPLPTTLDTLLPAGTTATVVGAETLTFSNFGYSPTPVAGSVPASAVNVLPFTVGNETGITYTAGWFAAAGTTVDIALTYVVTAPGRELINDVYLGLTGGVFGGTGAISVGETLRNAATGAYITSLEASIPGQLVSTGTFDGVQSILVTKDILIYGGSNGATVSIVDQGFSSTSIPEPTSMALLGIGMASFFAYRRLCKRHSAV